MDVVKETDSRWEADKCAVHCHFPAFKIPAKHIRWLHHAASLDKSMNRSILLLSSGELYCSVRWLTVIALAEAQAYVKASVVLQMFQHDFKYYQECVISNNAPLALQPLIALVLTVLF